MAATRENVLAAIVQYVETNKRRAPTEDIALAVGDRLSNVRPIIKALIADGTIESSRGRNGGSKPASAKPEDAQSDEQAPVSDDIAAQFAALVQQIEEDAEAQHEAALQHEESQLAV